MDARILRPRNSNTNLGQKRYREIYSDDDDDDDTGKNCGEPNKKNMLGLSLLEAEERRHYYRQYRENRTPSQKTRDLELGRERLRRYRERQKEKAADKKNAPPMNKMQEEAEEARKVVQREQWRRAKQKYLARETAGKKQERLARKRNTYRNRKQVISVKKKDFAKTISKLMNEDQKFITEMESVGIYKLGVVNPRKSNFEIKCLLNIKRRMTELKKSRKATDRKKFGFLINTVAGRRCFDAHMRQMFDVRKETWTKYSRTEQSEQKKRCDALPEDVLEEIEEFYLGQSTMLGGKKFARADGTQKRAMSRTLKRAYDRWMAKDGSAKLSFSKFSKLRPKYVATVDTHKFRTALCEVCLQIGTNVAIIKSAANKYSVPEVAPGDKYEAVDMTLCATLENADLACVDRTCENCGSILLLKKLERLMEVVPKDETFTSYRWQTRKFVKGKRRSRVKSQGKFSLSLDFTVHRFPCYSSHNCTIGINLYSENCPFALKKQP